MSKLAKASKIAVGNELLTGVTDKLPIPTFAVDFSGLGADRLDAEIADLAFLQTVAPVFRVVVISDAPIYGAVRQYGWPVEHLLSPESAARLLAGSADARYRRDRVAIVERHYENLAFIDLDSTRSIASSVALALGKPELTDLLPPRAWHPTALRWPDVTRQLRESARVEFASSDGAVVLSAAGNAGNELLVHADEEPLTERDLLQRAEPDVFRVRATFASHSSTDFEAMVYIGLARSFGSGLAAVSPWRETTIESPQVAQWIDIGMAPGEGARVHAYYAQHYKILTGTDELIWPKARVYAAARRVARDLTTRGG